MNVECIAIGFSERLRDRIRNCQHQAHTPVIPILADKVPGEINVLDVVECDNWSWSEEIRVKFAEEMRHRNKRLGVCFAETCLP